MFCGKPEKTNIERLHQALEDARKLARRADDFELIEEYEIAANLVLTRITVLQELVRLDRK